MAISFCRERFVRLALLETVELPPQGYYDALPKPYGVEYDAQKGGHMMKRHIDLLWKYTWLCFITFYAPLGTGSTPQVFFGIIHAHFLRERNDANAYAQRMKTLSTENGGIRYDLGPNYTYIHV